MHTTVITQEGNIFEVQIRTEEMHLIAEEGIAAHWKYKEGKPAKEKDEVNLAWLRRMVEWQQDVSDPHEFMKSFKIDLYPDEVYCFTPKGDVFAFPKKATVIDFAYAIHTEIGHHCTGAKVNGRMVSFKSQLKNGDKVEIITSPRQHPRRDWLKIVKTSRARSKIRQWLNKYDLEQREEVGKKLLSKELRRQNTNLKKFIKHKELSRVASELGYKKEEDPLPGEDIVGFITRGKGIAIHSVNCPNVKRLLYHPEREIEVKWDLDKDVFYPAKISIHLEDRPGLMANITAKIADAKVNIKTIETKTLNNKRALIHLVLDIKDIKQLDKIVKSLKKINGIYEIERI